MASNSTIGIGPMEEATVEQVTTEALPTRWARHLTGWPIVIVLFLAATFYFFSSLLRLGTQPPRTDSSLKSLASLASNDMNSVYYLPAGIKMPPPLLKQGEKLGVYVWVSDCTSCSAALSTCLAIGEKEKSVCTIVVVRESQMRKGLFADYPDALVLTDQQAVGPTLVVPSPGVMVVADTQGVVQLSATDPKEVPKWLAGRI